MSTQDNPTTQSSLGAGLLRFVLTVLIAVLLGPFIAGLLLFVFSVVLTIVQSDFQLSDTVGLLVLMMVGAYVLGTWIAAVAGFLVAMWGLWRQPGLPVVVVAAIIGTVVVLPIVQPHVRSLADPATPRTWLLTLLVAAASAIVCWLIGRRVLGKA